MTSVGVFNMELDRRGFLSGIVGSGFAGAALAQAAPSPVTAHSGLTGEAVRHIRRAEGSGGVRVYSFTPSGGYVIIDALDRRLARNIPSECFAALQRLQTAGEKIVDVAFSNRSADSWVILTDRRFVARDVEDRLVTVLNRLIFEDGVPVYRVILNPHDSNMWIVVHQNGFDTHRVQQSLIDQIFRYGASPRQVHNVIFDQDGAGWCVFADDDFFARGMNTALFTEISAMRAQNRRVDVCAISPQVGTPTWVALSNRPDPQGTFAQDVGTAETIWDWMEQRQVTGFQIAVIRNNRIDWSASYGRRQFGERARLTGTTRMQCASISKAITGVGLMHLVNDGALSLNDRLSRRLGDWTLPVAAGLPTGQSTDPRVFDLATHRAGTIDRGYGGYRPGTALPSLLDIMDGRSPANSGAITVSYQPTTRCVYSGSGFTLLQRVMEQADSRGFADLMHDRVLAPLDMDLSFFGPVVPRELADETAANHARRQNGVSLVQGGRNLYPELAAAGLYSTASDLARVVIMLNQLGQTDRGRYLPQAVARQIIRPQHSMQVMFGNTMSADRMGIGFRLRNVGTGNVPPINTYYHHGGANEGVSTYMRGYPLRGAGVVVISNFRDQRNVPDPTASARALADRIVNHYGW